LIVVLFEDGGRRVPGGTTMERPAWAPNDIDLDRPSAARVYDYYLGGSHNFAADRAMADKAMQILPELPAIMRANRAFLGRAVRYLAAAGITQFIDLGSGIPTVGNVHEVARELEAGARVVYVDNDPIAVVHARSLLASDPLATVIEADLREPGKVLGHPQLQRLINLDQPVGVLMVAVLHFVGDEDRPSDIIARYRAAMAPGSHLVVSHGTAANRQEQGARMEALYARSPTPLTPRSAEEVATLLSGFEIIDPGVVYLPLWRPGERTTDGTPAAGYATYAAVAHL